MPHHTELIATMSVALALAFVAGFAATRLHLPAIVGYLLAGVAVGPFTPGFVADTELAPQLAEIGVILLMFGVGIHFSLRDLLDVRAVAIPGAIGQIVAATALALGLALWWGWSLEAGLVLGLAISVASTVVLLRALQERGAIDSTQGRIAVGWLIVEDLITVLALVLLPVLATQREAEGVTASVGDVLATVGLALGKVALLSVVMIFVGGRFVPWLLVQVTRTGSKELFTLAVLAVALGVAYASAVVFGVSFALGAFLAGLVVGESDLSHEAAEDALPLRDAFAVLFFVSVGMLLDPSFLLASPGRILAIVVLIVVGKPLAAFLLVLALGHPARTGLVVAAGRGQIGEFSFILAELGRSLGLLPDEGYNLILAGALLSITLNPLLFRATDAIEARLRRPGPVGDPAVGAARAEPAERPTDPDRRAPRDHAVLCGYGRVGRLIGEAFERHGVPYLIVDEDRGRVEDARRHGTAALHGDVADGALARHLGLAEARVLVVAIPDPLATRYLVEEARRQNPNLAIVVRTHSQDEWAYLTDGRVSDAVLGEQELANAMTRLSLRHVGVDTGDDQAAPRTALGTG